MVVIVGCSSTSRLGGSQTPARDTGSSPPSSRQGSNTAPLIERVTAGGVALTARVGADAGRQGSCTGALCATRPPGCPTVGTVDVSVSEGTVTASDSVPILAPTATSGLDLLGGGIATVGSQKIAFVIAQISSVMPLVSASFSTGSTDEMVPVGGLAVLAGLVSQRVAAPTVVVSGVDTKGVRSSATWGGRGTDWIGCSPDNVRS
jgi:hypothetical protein